MSDCIFCKLATGEIPTDIVTENDFACAFRDASPQAPVHILVVPKAHHDNILDGLAPHELSAMLELVSKVTAQEDLQKSGFRIIMNTGADAGQTVNHLHMHILGGKNLGEGLVP